MLFFKILLISYIFSPLLFAQDKNSPPLLITKQTVQNIRYLTQDGRVTYFKKRTGGLLFSSNYKSDVLIESPPQTEFFVTASPSKKHVLIEVIEDFHSLTSLDKDRDIYIGNFNESLVKKFVTGTNPRLHLKDNWMSYYQPTSKKIQFQSTSVATKKIEIPIEAQSHALFNPEVIMLNEENIYYTDRDKEGHAFIGEYNSLTKLQTIPYKSPQIGTKIELAKSAHYLVVGEFSIEDTNKGSRIFYYEITNDIISSPLQQIYKSIENDLGNIIVENDSVYFIKTTSEDHQLQKRDTEVAQLLLPRGKLNVLTKSGIINQLIDMDGKILAPLRGEYLVISGLSDLSDADKLNPSKKTSKDTEVNELEGEI